MAELVADVNGTPPGAAAAEEPTRAAPPAADAEAPPELLAGRGRKMEAVRRAVAELGDAPPGALAQHIRRRFGLEMALGTVPAYKSPLPALSRGRPRRPRGRPVAAAPLQGPPPPPGRLARLPEGPAGPPGWGGPPVGARGRPGRGGPPRGGARRPPPLPADAAFARRR